MQNFVDIWQYMPHGLCLLWQPWLVVLWAGSDLLIFLSYSAIPIALLTVLRKRNDVPHSGLVVLFASFILLCGLTHLMGIVTLWYPIYPWVGLLKLATGIISFITAIALFRLIPVLVSLPSPTDLSEANSKLRDEVAAHEATLASLEAQVEERTAELRELNAKLAVQAREAVHRSGNLLAVVSSLARQSAQKVEDIDSYVDKLLGRISALASATATVLKGDDESSEGIEKVVREQVTPLFSEVENRVTIEGPRIAIGSEAAQQISLAVHELATNSCKYGFASTERGSLRVNWRVERDNEEDWFVFEWEETQPGLQTAEGMTDKREGFGSKLLTRVVPVMLRGTAERTMDDGVFRYLLKVPVAAIVPDRAKSIGESGQAAQIVDQSFGIG